MPVEGTEQVIQAGSTPARVPSETVTIALDDYHRFRGIAKEFDAFKSAQAEALATKERERLDALADSGKHKQALEETRTTYEKQIQESRLRYADLETTVYQKETRTTLAQALAGRTFNGSKPEEQSMVASQLLAILEPQFEASRLADGSIQVRHKVTGRPAPDVLKEALDSPAFAHFFVPTNRGGAGSDATRSPGNPQKNPSGSFEAIKEGYFNNQAKLGTVGMGLAGLTRR